MTEEVVITLSEKDLIKALSKLELKMVYIQKNRDGIPHHFDCACAMYGVMDLGLEYTLVTMEEVMNGKWDTLIRSRVFVGSVEFMTEVFKRIGIEQPKLPKNNLRPEKRMLMSELQYEKPVFIKPTSIKKFTGTVIDEMNIQQYKHHYPDTEIIVQDVIDFQSEWRTYVFRNKVVDIKHYSGDLRVDFQKIYDFVEELMDGHPDMVDFPETFVIDIGVYYEKGEFLRIPKHSVIEFNDMWAIGNYGVNNDLYVRMLKDRYFDIIKKGNKF